MTTLRERAAQAIWERGTSDLRWDELTDNEREQMGDIADAAIAAVRGHLSEPGEAMCEAGGIALDGPDERAADVWRAMLAAAFEGKA